VYLCWDTRTTYLHCPIQVQPEFLEPIVLWELGIYSKFNFHVIPMGLGLKDHPVSGVDNYSEYCHQPRQDLLRLSHRINLVEGICRTVNRQRLMQFQCHQETQISSDKHTYRYHCWGLDGFVSFQMQDQV